MPARLADVWIESNMLVTEGVMLAAAAGFRRPGLGEHDTKQR